MAALRQFLNGRGHIKDELSGSFNGSVEDNSRMMSMTSSYSNSPPTAHQKSSSHSQGNRYGDTPGMRPLHSKFSDAEGGNWQHPALRRQDGPDDSRDDYNRSNSFDQSNQYRPAPLRSATTDNIPNIHRSSNSAFEMDQSSLYEENESPSLSPALHNHLALRPLNVPSDPRRRRSRSVTEDDRFAGSSDQWNGYGKKITSDKPTRKESLSGASKPLPDTKETRAVQLLKDRQRPPTRQENRQDLVAASGNKGPGGAAQMLSQQSYQARYDSQPRNELNHTGATKVANSVNDTSPTGSVDNGVNDPSQTLHQGRNRTRKRSRDLDYSIQQLADMSYQQLKDESFDHVPYSAKAMASFNLPDPKVPLPERLQQIYLDRSHKDRELRARGFFSSLTIDQYEECGDLLLDGFRNVIDKLRHARQEKRRAARTMEEQVRKREELVRKKRGIIEQDLGRLKSAGSAVVKPTR